MGLQVGHRVGRDSPAQQLVRVPIFRMRTSFKFPIVFSLQLVPSCGTCADADWEMGMQNPSTSENDSNRAASNRLTLRVMKDYGGSRIGPNDRVQFQFKSHKPGLWKSRGDWRDRMSLARELRIQRENMRYWCGTMYDRYASCIIAGGKRFYIIRTSCVLALFATGIDKTARYLSHISVYAFYFLKGLV